MGRKKKFFDKKKSATFQLLARDSSDPNYSETPGSDRIFVRVDTNPFSAESFFPENSTNDVSGDGDDPDSIFAEAPEDVDDGGDAVDMRFGNSVNFPGGFGGKEAPLPEHVRKEILELGFPDDGYNYLLHMREIKNAGGGSSFYENPKPKFDQLPRDVKAYDASRVRVPEVKSDEANDKSIYSVASKTFGVRVQKVVDPEVAALLDDSDLSRFGSDVEDLEEDFVVHANIHPEGEELDADEEFNLIEESEVINEATNEYGTSGHQGNTLDHVGEERAENSRVKAGSDFVSENLRVRRPLDDEFDLLECQEYGSGDDDDGEYDGYVAEEDEYLANKLKHALKDGAMDGLNLSEKYEAPADLLRGNEEAKSAESVNSAADIIRRCVEYGEGYDNEDKDEDIVVVQESSDDSEEWDCESIISTYSNLDNHPAKIGAPGTARKKKLVETVSRALNSTDHVIALRGKEKLPLDFLSHGRKSDSESLKSVPVPKTEQQKRKQHGQESKEEKKERKAAVKEEKREARRIKKEVKELYRCEAQRAQRVAAVAGPSSFHLD